MARAFGQSGLQFALQQALGQAGNLVSSIPAMKQFAQQGHDNEQALFQAQQKHQIVQAMEARERERSIFEGDRTFDLASRKQQLAEDAFKQKQFEFANPKDKKTKAQKGPTLTQQGSLVDRRLKRQKEDVQTNLQVAGVDSPQDVAGAAQAGLDRTEGGFLGFGGTPSPDSTVFKLQQALQNIGSPQNRLSTQDSLPGLFPERFPQQQQAGNVQSISDEELKRLLGIQ